MKDRFVNRENELAALEAWWNAPGAGLALVFGRRRVGKTALLSRFSRSKETVFHTAANRPPFDELRLVSQSVRQLGRGGVRDLEQRPFVDWDDALDYLAEYAEDRPLLLILDEYPELLKTWPGLSSILRAFWDRARGRTQLRILLCGSAVRTMEALQEERAPLFGRFDLRLRLHPFRPWEAVLMHPGMDPATFALVWGIVGGIPLYLEWWNSEETVRANLARLVCAPGGRLLSEGEYLLRGEGGDLAERALYAIARGRTRFHEIRDALDTNPSRTLDHLAESRLVEKQVPVTEREGRTRRTVYRIHDNFLAFWLMVVARYRTEIERGLGATILPALLQELEDFMGPRWEEAFRWYLRREAAEGRIHPEVVAIGPYWADRDDPAEIDAVVLAGRRREAVLVGEAKWAKRVNADRIRYELERKARSLPTSSDLRYVVCARERVTGRADVGRVTAGDVFAP